MSTFTQAVQFVGRSGRIPKNGCCWYLESVDETHHRIKFSNQVFVVRADDIVNIAPRRPARQIDYVPGTFHKKCTGLSGDFPRELLSWAVNNAWLISARAGLPQFDRFAANLQHANGQVFHSLMDGFLESDIWGINICVDFSNPIPEEFDDAIYKEQHRCGIRAYDDSRTARYPRKAFCNELGWELLRAGLPLG